MKHSDSLAAIGAAMARAQVHMKVALKESKNPHLNTKYADLGSVWEACREALGANGLSVIQLPVADDVGYIALETIILHSSGEYIANTARTPARDPKGNESAQSVGSALTYLRRYALSSALGIVADDDDGHAASQAAAKTAEPDRSKDDVVIGTKGAERLTGELHKMGVTKPLTFAAKICRWPDLDDLSLLTVKQARQLKHAAGTGQKVTP